mmetsp:Transcript_26393/g.72559  ORF Transcript_26393/g.72559 Transcript_26393/m.72559 type:complete len:80 (-) Transcript_26393:655-894(-)
MHFFGSPCRERPNAMARSALFALQYSIRPALYTTSNADITVLCCQICSVSAVNDEVSRSLDPNAFRSFFEREFESFREP